MTRLIVKFPRFQTKHPVYVGKRYRVGSLLCRSGAKRTTRSRRLGLRTRTRTYGTSSRPRLPQHTADNRANGIYQSKKEVSVLECIREFKHVAMSFHGAHNTYIQVGARNTRRRPEEKHSIPVYFLQIRTVV